MRFPMAEAVGFEPTSPWGLPDFESGPLWPLRYASVFNFCAGEYRKNVISSQARYDHFDTLPYHKYAILRDTRFESIPIWPLWSLSVYINPITRDKRCYTNESRLTGMHSDRSGTDERLSCLRPQQTYVYYHIFVLFASLFWNFPIYFSEGTCSGKRKIA